MTSPTHEPTPYLSRSAGTLITASRGCLVSQLAGAPPERLDSRTLVPPIVWAAFFWSYVVATSSVMGQTFYALVRGVGAVDYSSAIVIVSRSFGLEMLAGVSVVLLGSHFLIMRRSSVSDPLALGALVAFFVGLSGLVFSPSPLYIIFLGLASVVIVAFDARGLSEKSGASVGILLTAFAFFVISVLAAVALISDIRWIAGGFDGSVPFSDQSWGVAFAGLQLVAFLGPFLPELALLFLFTWVLRLAVPAILRWAGLRTKEEGITRVADAAKGWTSPRWSMVILGIAVIVAAFVGIYPYLPSVNPDSALVGVDVRYCYSHVLNSQPVTVPCGPSAHQYLTERYGTFLLLQGLAQLAGSNTLALEAAFPILAVLLVVSTYLLTLEGTQDRTAASVSALFAAVSPTVIAGVNAGLLSNWLAISVVFFFFAAVLRGLRTRQLRHILLAYALFVVLLVVHPWTWAMTLGVLAAFLSVSLIEAAWSRRLRSKTIEMTTLASLLLVALGADALRSLLPAGSGLGVAISSILPGLSVSNVPLVLENLKMTFVMFLLGGLSDPIWFVLGTAGILSIASLKDPFGKLLATWLAAISIGVVLVGPPPASTYQARLLYELPFQILGAVGFLAIVKALAEPVRGQTPYGGGLVKLIFVLALVAVVGLLLGFTLDNVGYLYRGVPGA